MDRMREAKARDMPLLGMALLTGVLAGVIGGVFRWLIVRLEDGRGAMVESLESMSAIGWIVPVVLTTGATMLAVFLVRRFAPEACGSGIQELEGALDGVRRMRWHRIIPVKFVGGLLGIGAGLVLGREGPTIQMGGSLGQMLHKRLRAQPETANVLIAAGAGAGLTAAFTAPLAGVLFVIEEMRPQFKYGVLSVHAVILACIGSAIMVRLVVGDEPTMAMLVFDSPAMKTLWMFAILGIVFGGIGYVFNRLVLFSSGAFGALSGARLMVAVGAVGAVIGALVWFRPYAAGEGDAVAHAALSGNIVVDGLLILFVMRLATTVLCYGTGAPGGIFAPMLALGTLLSMWLGHLAYDAMPDLAPAPGVFAVAGMAALFAASVRAPLTAIALTIEITWNFELILPLMVTCLTATLVAHLLGGRPIYTDLLALALKRAGPHVD